MKHDKVYHDLLEDILLNGIIKQNRTGVETISVFGRMIDYDVSEFVPILTTKKLHLKSIIHELLWFIKGDTNVKYLRDNGVTIWDEWANEKGDLGPVYGAQWRKWPTSKVRWVSSSETEQVYIDQLQRLIDTIKSDPNSRRLMVSAWNPEFLPDETLKPHENPELGLMALAPCHYGFQIIIEEDRMSLMWNQRSIDVFLGLPYNIASYCMLLYMIAQLTGYKPHRLIGSLGDAHLYVNHLDQVKTLQSRDFFDSPRMVVTPRDSIDDFQFDDIEVLDYQAHPPIKAPIAV